MTVSTSMKSVLTNPAFEFSDSKSGHVLLHTTSRWLSKLAMLSAVCLDTLEWAETRTKAKTDVNMILRSMA
jgi:hypothetical protein